MNEWIRKLFREFPNSKFSPIPNCVKHSITFITISERFWISNGVCLFWQCGPLFIPITYPPIYIILYFAHPVKSIIRNIERETVKTRRTITNNNIPRKSGLGRVFLVSLSRFGTFKFSDHSIRDSSSEPSLSIQKYPCCYRVRVSLVSHGSSTFSRSSPGRWLCWSHLRFDSEKFRNE